ncbi:MAG: excinuclease ABC subunit UvrC [Lachnospiraceae bacterium]|jgi:excinuclease ABC subunit C
MASFDITEELKKLPGNPGVYLMRNERDEIIYIGKAKILKNRVRQYFDKGRSRSLKIEKMVSQIACFEYIVTDSEVEALILENNLIKEHRPRYNTMLKDDKTYPYIKLTLSEAYPRLQITRKVKKDKDKYYGPYPNGSIGDIVELLNRAYGLRSCRKVFPRDFEKDRPCLNYHIGRCEGICTGNVTEEEYTGKIKNVRKFLEGSSTELLDRLRTMMLSASAKMEYERAAEYKELLRTAENICQSQKMEYDPKDNRDVLGLAVSGFDAVMQVFFIRNGKLIDREKFFLTVAPDEAEPEIISSFIKQYYAGTAFLPSQIHLPCNIEDVTAIEEWLSRKAAGKVSIYAPQKGKKEKMVELAEQNARLAIAHDKEKAKHEEMRTKGAVTEISKMLGINYAKRVESYDISNIAGYESVGSMVVFEDGRPKKNDYRKFKIKTVTGPDDYASMAEVLKRRFSHQEWEKPDLLLIDGGKGQISAVKEALGEDCNVPICGMIKDERHRTRGLIYEGREYEMERGAATFKLITRIQDETHRFALEYHRQLRGKTQVRSILDDIPGIGPKRRLALIRHFKSVERLKEADIGEILQVPEMNLKVAEAVVEFFRER